MLTPYQMHMKRELLSGKSFKAAVASWNAKKMKQGR